MKPFLIVFVVATTVVASQAQAFGPTMNTLTPDLTFPIPAPEVVSQDQVKTNK